MIASLPEGTPDFPEFKPFPKIPRLRRGCVITEKIDGTNAGILIDESGRLFAACRTRWVTPGKDGREDNFGFASWVRDHAQELRTLGPGMHWGEWWGRGIQRGYGLRERRFSLFNTARWPNGNQPPCCHVVPFLGGGPFTDEFVQGKLEALRTGGSVAAPGWKSEGVVVFHPASGGMFKVLLENDELAKGQAGPSTQPTCIGHYDDGVMSRRCHHTAEDGCPLAKSQEAA